MTAPVPDHAALPVEKLRVTPPTPTEPQFWTCDDGVERLSHTEMEEAIIEFVDGWASDEKDLEKLLRETIAPLTVYGYSRAEVTDKRVGGVPVKQRKDPKVAELRWGPKAPRVRTSLANWRKPLQWNAEAAKAKRRDRVFCASLADVFEDREELLLWRRDLFGLIAATPHLDWLLLTKRPENIARLWPKSIDRGGYVMTCPIPSASDWPNVWLGTTVEDQQRANERIPELLKVPASVYFLSCEPLLESVNLTRVLRQIDDAARVDWVIIGGESGGNARPFDVAWARSLVKQARAAGASPFVKQFGSYVRTRNDDMLSSDFSEGGWQISDDETVEDLEFGFQGADVRVRLRDHHGGDMAEWPEDLRVREFPR